jgi:hypothetical protein
VFRRHFALLDLQISMLFFLSLLAHTQCSMICMLMTCNSCPYSAMNMKRKYNDIVTPISTANATPTTVPTPPTTTVAISTSVTEEPTNSSNGNTIAMEEETKSTICNENDVNAIPIEHKCRSLCQRTVGVGILLFAV